MLATIYITAAIMMTVTGISRWSKIKLDKKFWDQRPFSRIIVGAKALATITDYIKINQYEGLRLAKHIG